MFIFLDSFVCLICLLSLTSFDVEYDVTLTNCGVMNGVEKKLTNLSCFGSNDESAKLYMEVKICDIVYVAKAFYFKLGCCRCMYFLVGCEKS